MSRKRASLRARIRYLARRARGGLAPVSLITIHHEGAGTPIDSARGGAGGYSEWIGDVNGDHVFVAIRTPWQSWGTLHYNGVSLDICLSGDRDVIPLTDDDIDTLAACVAQARALGWVTDTPLVRAHRNSPGSRTVCPGAHTMARWPDVVRACTKPAAPQPAPTPQPKVRPVFDPPLQFIDFLENTQPGGGVWALSPDGGILALGAPLPPAPFGANTLPGFVGTAAQLVAPNAAEKRAGTWYTILNDRGQRYAFGPKK